MNGRKLTIKNITSTKKVKHLLVGIISAAQNTTSMLMAVWQQVGKLSMIINITSTKMVSI
jgi:hypothetical protein